MPIALRATLSILVVLGLADMAHASSSDWFETDGARVRLVTAGLPDAQGKLRGVLDIDLAPGWKTYWRDPGDSGVPPSVEVTAPSGVVAELDFPVPGRHEDDGSVWAGYDTPTRLPVTFSVGRTAAGAFETSVFLGICETMCVPVQTTLRVDPGADPDNAADATLVREAFSALPREATPDFGAKTAKAANGRLVLESSAPSGVHIEDIFLAAPEGYWFGPPIRSERDDKVMFALEFSRPAGATSGKDIPYTLVGDTASVNGILPGL